MRHVLTKTELVYLKSLLSRIEKFGSGLKGTTIHDEIKIMKEIYKRKYINTDVEFDGRLKNLYNGEAELINSWKSWYISKNKS